MRISIGDYPPASNLLHLAGVLVDVAVTTADGILLLRAAVQGAVRTVQLVQAEGNGNVKDMLAAVLPVHLAPVVVELAVGAAREPGDPPAAGVAVLRGLAVGARHRDDALTGKSKA